MVRSELRSTHKGRYSTPPSQRAEPPELHSCSKQHPSVGSNPGMKERPVPTGVCSALCTTRFRRCILPHTPDRAQNVRSSNNIAEIASMLGIRHKQRWERTNEECVGLDRRRRTREREQGYHSTRPAGENWSAQRQRILQLSNTRRRSAHTTLTATTFRSCIGSASAA